VIETPSFLQAARRIPGCRASQQEWPKQQPRAVNLRIARDGKAHRKGEERPCGPAASQAPLRGITSSSGRIRRNDPAAFSLVRALPPNGHRVAAKSAQKCTLSGMHPPLTSSESTHYSQYLTQVGHPPLLPEIARVSAETAFPVHAIALQFNQLTVFAPRRDPDNRPPAPETHALGHPQKPRNSRWANSPQVAPRFLPRSRTIVHRNFHPGFILGVS
jgi:hypothetical protein